MGNNYYAIAQKCPTCGNCRSQDHIGKKSLGWQFYFEGCYPQLTQARQWHEILSMDGIEIHDEYDKIIEFDEFWEMVYNSLKDQNNINHTRIMNLEPETCAEKEYCKKLSRLTRDVYQQEKKRCWIDDEGFAFIDGYFI